MRCSIAALMLLLAAVGCSRPLAKATFEVEVVNNTAGPLSVGLTKSGGPPEDGWVSPAEVAIGAPALSDRRWGTLLAPKQRIVLGPLEGRFNPGSSAVVTAYAADATVEELLAYSRTDADRTDIYLMPGRSSYVIERARGGRLTHRPAEGGQR